MTLFATCLFVLLLAATWLWPRRRARTRTWWAGAGAAGLALIGAALAVAGDIVAQKALALLLMPASLAWLALIALTAAAWRSAPRPLALLASATLATYSLAGNAWLGDALIASLERRIPAMGLATLAPFEAVFVLGGGSDGSSDDGPQFASAGDRIALAARLWHAGLAPTLVASGSSLGELEPERDLGAETALLWRGLGVPATAIITLPGPVNTTQEIAAYAQLIRQRGWTRVGLVSSAWHLPRAMSLAQAQGLAMVPLGADRRAHRRTWSLYWLIPREDGFERVQHACWEYLGMLRGR